MIGIRSAACRSGSASRPPAAMAQSRPIPERQRGRRTESARSASASPGMIARSPPWTASAVWPGAWPWAATAPTPGGTSARASTGVARPAMAPNRGGAPHDDAPPRFADRGESGAGPPECPCDARQVEGGGGKGQLVQPVRHAPEMARMGAGEYRGHDRTSRHAPTSRAAIGRPTFDGKPSPAPESNGATRPALPRRATCSGGGIAAGSRSAPANSRASAAGDVVHIDPTHAYLRIYMGRGAPDQRRRRRARQGRGRTFSGSSA
jgi:hypothetical protein